MAVSPIVISKAFCDVLYKTPKETQGVLFKRFAKILDKYGLTKDKEKIFKEIKNNIARREAVSLINVESARELNTSQKNKIISVFNKKDFFTFKIKPEHIAGLKIIIDENLSIDNTILSKLKCLK